MFHHGDSAHIDFPEPRPKEESIWGRILFTNSKYHLWYVKKYSWGGSGFVSLCGKGLNGKIQNMGDDGTRRCKACEKSARKLHLT